MQVSLRGGYARTDSGLEGMGGGKGWGLAWVVSEGRALSCCLWLLSLRAPTYSCRRCCQSVQYWTCPKGDVGGWVSAAPVR
eukprot:scaffold171439_cov17-Tisochrysis_lutea.AAC.1